MNGIGIARNLANRNESRLRVANGSSDQSYEEE
jgi:hypothetical protein